MKNIINKKHIYFIAFIVIILFLTFICYYKFFRTAKEFVLDSEDKYIVRTNDFIITAMSDGGTHYDVRYNVDLDNKKITKVQDYYKGFEGCKYKNRIIYERKLNDIEVDKIREIFEEIKENNYEKNEDKIGFIDYYEIYYINDEIREVYSNEIKKLMEK